MYPVYCYATHSLNYVPFSLIVDHTLRPTPKEMLTHPWVAGIMKKEVPMGRWIREVWGWRPTQSSNVYVLPTLIAVIFRSSLFVNP